MELSSPGAYVSIAFSTLHQQLKLVGTSSNQFGLVLCEWQIDSIRNGVACHITSDLDFDWGSCVIEIEWTKALYYNCQPML